MHHIARQIYAALKRANHVLLIPHQHPDGDALGSVTAFIEFLHREGKSWSAYCATEKSEKFSYLPHIESVRNDETIWQDRTVDCIVVFDSGDLRYAGVAHHIDAMPQKPTIINIDHHVTNERYGHFNLVLPMSSSTTEVLYTFFATNAIRLNPAMATSLLTGLLTDTDNFTNAATSPRALTIGHELMMIGAKTKMITASVFRDKSIRTLHLWGLVLSRLEKHPIHDLAYTYALQEDLRTHDVDDGVAEGIANFLTTLGESRMTLLLKEQKDGNMKGSFRTTRDDTDVSSIAKALGGGGHKKAAGFTVSGPIETALEHITHVLDCHSFMDKPSV